MGSPVGSYLVRPRRQSREADEEEKERAHSFLDGLEKLAELGSIKLFYQDEAKWLVCRPRLVPGPGKGSRNKSLRKMITTTTTSMEL